MKEGPQGEEKRERERGRRSKERKERSTTEKTGHDGGEGGERRAQGVRGRRWTGEATKESDQCGGGSQGTNGKMRANQATAATQGPHSDVPC